MTDTIKYTITRNTEICLAYIKQMYIEETILKYMPNQHNDVFTSPIQIKE